MPELRIDRKKDFKLGLKADASLRSRIDENVEVRKAEKQFKIAEKRQKLMAENEGGLNSVPTNTTDISSTLNSTRASSSGLNEASSSSGLKATLSSTALEGTSSSSGSANETVTFPKLSEPFSLHTHLPSPIILSANDERSKTGEIIRFSEYSIEFALANGGKNLEYILPMVATAVKNDEDRDTQKDAVVFIRNLLSYGTHPPIQQIVDINIASKLCELAKMDQTDDEVNYRTTPTQGNRSDNDVSFECLWALTNIASGDSRHTLHLAQSGGIECFLEVLKSKKALQADICDQAIWGLGNIMGDDSSDFRSNMIDRGIVFILQNVCTAVVELPWSLKNKEKVMARTMWVLSNCCRGKPTVEFHKIKPCLRVFAEVIAREMKPTIICDALFGIHRVIDIQAIRKNEEEPNMRLEELMLVGTTPLNYVQSGTEQPDPELPVAEVGMIPLIRALAKIIEPKLEPVTHFNTEHSRREFVQSEFIICESDEEEQCRMGALKILGELIAAEDRKYTDICCLSGIVPALLKCILQVESMPIVTKALYILSNLLAGVTDQVHAAIAPWDLSPNTNLNALKPVSVGSILSYDDYTEDIERDGDAALPKDNPPPPEKEFITAFDVLYRLFNNVKNEGHHPGDDGGPSAGQRRGGGGWTSSGGYSSADTMNRMKFDVIKEIIYCYTQFFGDNSLPQIEKKMTHFCTKWFHHKKHDGSQYCLENTMKANIISLDENSSLVVEDRIPGYQGPLEKLFEHFKAESLIQYDMDKYSETHQHFMNILDYWMNYGIVRNVDLPLMEAVINALTNVMSSCQEADSCSDKSKGGTKGMLYPKLVHYALEIGMDDTLITMLDLLAAKPSENAEEVSSQIEEFMDRYLPDDDEW